MRRAFMIYWLALAGFLSAVLRGPNAFSRLH